MKRAIVGYHQGDNDLWVAELSCGHDRPVRRQPDRSALSEADGNQSVGVPVDCPGCDRAELPVRLRLVRSTPEWDERTIPAALRRSHRVAANTWGRIVVTSGQLNFRAATDPPLQTVVNASRSQPIPPGVEHQVQPVGSVRFSIDFLAVEPAAPVPPTTGRPSPQGAERSVTDQGGDPACWAGLLCEDCGVVLDGSGHRPGCGHTPRVS
jgi:tellurite resistance-related uncharacterized protein